MNYPCYNRTMLVYLCRHGQTTGDIEDRYGGKYDDHLTELGKQQAQKLAESLSDKNIQIIYTSPRIRARETTEIVNKAVQANVEIIDNFCERNHYGVLTGMIKAEAKEKYPEQVALLQDTHNTVEGGETYEHFKTRILHALDQVLHSGYNSVAIITHGGPIRLIFREILNKGKIKIDDCAVALLESKDKVLELKKVSGIA
ncbi:MAG: histidine phosphatase family protein [Bacteroidetes bacterium]|nr:MAG: histidine phosphatase family protein [Bacteroidota bacterium]